jgi:hypothetical protein
MMLTSPLDSLGFGGRGGLKAPKSNQKSGRTHKKFKNLQGIEDPNNE